jgi:energy-coupling factor transporter ATP-binding protein EcfA2
MRPVATVHAVALVGLDAAAGPGRGGLHAGPADDPADRPPRHRGARGGGPGPHRGAAQRGELAAGQAGGQPRARRPAEGRDRVRPRPSRSPSSPRPGRSRSDALTRVYAIGEVGLDGTVRAVPGVLPAAAGARDHGARRCSSPRRPARGRARRGAAGRPGRRPRRAGRCSAARRRPGGACRPAPVPALPGEDLRDVRGQAVARRAIELAAAGGHHVLLSGPPGCGKTMLARRLHGLLPAARRRRGARGRGDPVPRGGAAPRRTAVADAAAARTAPHRLGRGSHRWRQRHPTTGGAGPRAPGVAPARRAARDAPVGPRRAPAAARTRRGRHHPGAGDGAVPGLGGARRGDQPVSLCGTSAAPPAPAPAGRTGSSATAPACRGRCSIASTSRSSCVPSTATGWSARRRRGHGDRGRPGRGRQDVRRRAVGRRGCWRGTSGPRPVRATAASGGAPGARRRDRGARPVGAGLRPVPAGRRTAADLAGAET